MKNSRVTRRESWRRVRWLWSTGILRSALSAVMSCAGLLVLLSFLRWVVEMPEPVHLTYEEVSEYVDSKLDDAGRERMDAHTAICRSCAKELRDLQAFDARMTTKMIEAAVVEAGPGWAERVKASVAQFFWHSGAVAICRRWDWVNAAGRIQPAAYADGGRCGAAGFLRLRRM